MLVLSHGVPLFIGLILTTALASDVPNISGSWRLDYSIVSENKLPVVGRLKSASTAWALATIRRENGAWIQDHQVCGAAVYAGPVRSRLPDAYLFNVPLKTYALDVRVVDDHVSYRADTGMFWSGHDPGCGDVPITASDRCVWDWDGDGHPGATVKVKAPLHPWVDVYIAQRNHLVLNGQVSSVDRIDGHARMAEMSMQVLGASNRLFARNPVAEILPNESYFAMTRLKPGATCADVPPPRLRFTPRD